MLKPNIETFIGCDAEYCDARIVLYGAPLIQPPVFDPEHDSVLPPFVTKVSDWKLTAHIKTPIYLNVPFLTAETWNYALEVHRLL